MTEQAALCRVTPALVEHLKQLLADANLSGSAQPDGDLMLLTVPRADLERARSVIGLVLPDLLEPRADSARLSDRLVRTDTDSPQPPQLLDGRFALGRVSDEPESREHGIDEFVPPPPPAIPRPRDQISRLAWGGVILGPILLLLTALLGLPSIITAAGLAMFIGGFGTLVARHDQPPRDGWDDGAVV